MNDQLWDEIDEATDEARESRGERLMKLVGRIKTLPDYDSCPKLAYMVVYCLYMHPERLTSKGQQRAFDQAVEYLFELDPEHNLGKLYLGFHLFDLGRYRSAEKAFASVDQSVLTDQQRLKVAELRLCIKINKQGLQASLEAFQRFIGDAESVNEYDVFPVQLMNCLVSISSNTTDAQTARSIVEMTHFLIETIGQKDIFEEDLRIIAENLGPTGEST